jgi:hypothetical protein
MAAFVAERSKALLKLPQKGAWADAMGLLRPARPKNLRGITNMADDKVHPTATEMDYPAHFRNYDGFLRLFKYGAAGAFITALLVMYVIYN